MNSRSCTFLICLVCLLLLVQAGIAATESAGIRSSKGAKKGEDATSESSLTQKGVKEDVGQEQQMEKEEKQLDSELKEAVVFVSDLTKENVQKSLDILKKFEEIQVMKPDFEQNLIRIRYKEKLDFDTVIKELNNVFQDVKIKEITQADPAQKSKCGGCPNKAKCEEEAKKAADSQKSVEVGS